MFVISLIPITKTLKASKKGYSMSKQGATISHLWFMDDCKVYGKNDKELKSLMDIVATEAAKTGMEFGLNKCATLHMRRGKPQKASTEEMQLESGEAIPNLKTDEEYKYLGMQQRDTIDHKGMKDKLTKAYRNRIRTILKKTKLNSANTIKAINTWAVSVLRYTAGIIK